jgi:hypothetical protein
MDLFARRKAIAEAYELYRRMLDLDDGGLSTSCPARSPDDPDENAMLANQFGLAQEMAGRALDRFGGQ